MEKAINVYNDKSSVQLERSFVTKGLHDVKITNMFIVWCIPTEWHTSTIVLFGAPCKLDLYELVA